MGICIIRHTEKKRIILPVGEPAGNDNSDSETENFHCIVFSIRRKIDSGFMPEFIFYVYGGRSYV